MKKILLGALMVLLCGISQAQTAPSYKESGDTIFIGGKMLLPGDTIHLGFGSDPYKSFLFIHFFISKKYQTPSRLSYIYCNTFMIYKGTVTHKIGKVKATAKVFLANGYDDEIAHYLIVFPSAIAAKEIIRY